MLLLEAKLETTSFPSNRNLMQGLVLKAHVRTPIILPYLKLCDDIIVLLREGKLVISSFPSSISTMKANDLYLSFQYKHNRIANKNIKTICSYLCFFDENLATASFPSKTSKSASPTRALKQ